MARAASTTPTMGKTISFELSEEMGQYRHISVWHEYSKKTPTEDVLSNNKPRAARVNARAPIEKLEGSLQAVYDENRLTESI
jgi:hypothetical protein